MWFYIDYHTCIYDPVLSTVGTQSNDILVAVSTTRAQILTSKHPSPVNSTETLWRSDLSLRKKMQCTFSYFLSVLFILFLVSIFLVNLLYVGVGDHCLIFPYPFPFFQLPPELLNMPFSGKEQKNRTSTKVVFGNIPCLTSCHSQRQGVDLIFIESLGGGSHPQRPNKIAPGSSLVTSDMRMVPSALLNLSFLHGSAMHGFQH